MPEAAGIFISYRRIDTNWAAVSLKNHIARHLPGAPVFMDIETVEPGHDFVEAINANVDQCRILLAVIGPNWLTVSDNFGQRRLDDPNDFVRLEIARALERKIRVIPILVDGADMPPAKVLPNPLGPLSRRNAVTVNHHSHSRDFEEITKFLDKTFPDLAKGKIGPNPDERSPLPPSKATDVAATDDIGAEVAQALLDAGVDPKTMTSVAKMRWERGQYRVAEAIFRAAQPGLEKLEGQDSDWALNNRHNILVAVLSMGRCTEAEIGLRDLLSERERVHGPEHPGTLTARGEHASALLELGRSTEAESAFRELLPILEQVDGPEHPDTLTTRHQHACALLNLGRSTEAESALRELLPILERVNGPKHPGTLATRRQLATAALEKGDAATARHALAGVPDGDQDPVRSGRTTLLKAWLADMDGDAERADSLLDEAEQPLAQFDQAHYARRQLAKYRATRKPGRAGGTTLWALDGGA